MRTYDFAPLYRATVGFDQIADLMDQVASTSSNANTYPPYNIEKTDDDAYRISIAVAGFSDTGLSVDVKQSYLVVSATKTDEKDKTYLHRGIATRAFERRFHLADHIRVAGAKLEHGLLHVELVREVPEALRPRMIEIATTAETNGGAKVIEGETANPDVATKAA